MTENLLRKRPPPSGAVSLALATRRVASATVELESHLTLPPAWHASGKHSCSSQCQSMGLRWLGWTLEHKNHREDATVYPDSSQSMAYVHQLMILVLKSTQN
jgi:hypothetical protein